MLLGAAKSRVNSTELHGTARARDRENHGPSHCKPFVLIGIRDAHVPRVQQAIKTSLEDTPAAQLSSKNGERGGRGERGGSRENELGRCALGTNDQRVFGAVKVCAVKSSMSLHMMKPSSHLDL